MRKVDIQCLHGTHSGLVDIVFIHGFTGSPTETWTSPSGEFWPNWLLDEINGSSVYCIGYVSSALKINSDQSINQLATEILARIAATEQCASTPLVFVCHSLGGLLVKELLSVADSTGDAQFMNIAKNTKMVVFIGTPHAGVHSFEKLAPLLGKNMSGVLEALISPRGQGQLHNLNRFYRTFSIRQKIETLSFFETRPTFGGKILVDERDADIGVSNENGGLTMIPISANHTQICKPERGDTLFDTIVKRVTLLPLSQQSIVPTPNESRRRISNNIAPIWWADRRLLLGGVSILLVVFGLSIWAVRESRIDRGILSNPVVHPDVQSSDIEGGGEFESREWDKAQRVHAISGYEAFIRRFPNSTWSLAARDGIAEIIAWDSASAGNAIELFQSYIDRFPNGRHLADAKNEIARLDDEKWDLARKQEALDSYERYLTEVPNGKWSQEAARAIERLKLWNAVSQTGTVAAIERYLNKYPDAPNSVEVRRRFERQRESEMWASTLNLNTPAAFLEYKKKYPHGDHIKEADARLEEMSQSSRQIVPQADLPKRKVKPKQRRSCEEPKCGDFLIFD